VVRSGFVESVHLGSVAVADAEGRLTASAGDPGRVSFARSSMKPLQAAVSLSLIEEELSDAEAAVMCASHNGEPPHVAAVGSLLARGALGFEALRCPPDRPIDPESSLVVPEPRPEFHNCSGKHAGMLLACTARGWDPGSYRDPSHPLQGEVMAAVRTAGGEPEYLGVDGCGVPVHALPLVRMARLYARLAAPDRLGSLAPSAARATGAMRAQPYQVAGRDRVCTAAMVAVPGVILKVGAEGMICAALLERGLGVAVKVEDGSARALAPAVIRALWLLDALTAEQYHRLSEHARPPVLGGGRPVGELDPVFDLVAA
jgi:L-asparaginase II